jgi:hypothetical protein
MEKMNGTLDQAQPDNHVLICYVNRDFFRDY